MNGVTESVKKGDFFIIDFGSIHGYQKCRNLQLINCLFMPEIIDDTLAGCRYFDELLRVCLIRYHKQFFEQATVDRIFHDEDGRVLQLVLTIQAEYKQKSIGYREVFRCCLLEIMILTMRKALQMQERPRTKSSEQSQMVLEAVQYLSVNYLEKRVLGQFCEKYHYSQQYFSRRFKEETGLTALEYLHKVRIEKSCELLADTDLRIAEVAQQSGYEDIKFFNTVFGRMVHMSPLVLQTHY